jgi:DhnA family fructose-bisphosphate aldolase class Ia
MIPEEASQCRHTPHVRYVRQHVAACVLVVEVQRGAVECDPDRVEKPNIFKGAARQGREVGEDIARTKGTQQG